MANLKCKVRSREIHWWLHNVQYHLWFITMTQSTTQCSKTRTISGSGLTSSNNIHAKQVTGNELIQQEKIELSPSVIQWRSIILTALPIINILGVTIDQKLEMNSNMHNVAQRTVQRQRILRQASHLPTPRSLKASSARLKSEVWWNACLNFLYGF